MRVTESWRLKDERYKLGGVQSNENTSYPPRPVDPRKVEVFEFGRKVAETLRPKSLVSAEQPA